MTITPRQDFRASPHAKTWKDVVDSEQFQSAAKAAMLQFVMDMDANKSLELAGARSFLSKLMSLADEDTTPTTSTISPQLLRT